MTLLAPTNEILETIGDMAWNQIKTSHDKSITITDTHQHNACNHTYSGTVLHDGVTYGFIIESGNNAGTRVIEWGLEDDISPFIPPEPTNFTMIPDNNAISIKPDATADEYEGAVKRMMHIYNSMRKLDWFKKWEQSYNYDRHFQPGYFIENHYRAQPVAGCGRTLAQMNLRIGTLDELGTLEKKYLAS
jgi:hypothetical protein